METSNQRRRQKQGHWRNVRPLAPIPTATIKFSPTPRQININNFTNIPQFLLLATTCLAFNKKLHDMLKVKEIHSPKRQIKHQSQTQIWYKCWNYQTANLK